MDQNDFSDIVVNPPAPLTWRDYFTSEYLFETPPVTTRLYLPLIIAFGLMIVCAIMLKLLGKKIDEKISQRYFYPMIICGVFGYLYLFARYESLPWFSTRFFFVLILVTFVTWIIINSIWLIKYAIFINDHQKKTEKFEKYLPKPKK